MASGVPSSPPDLPPSDFPRREAMRPLASLLLAVLGVKAQPRRGTLHHVPDLGPIQGELQLQVMAALWRLRSGTGEQVRSALPPRYRSANTTVQTVLNRLADRGLLARSKEGGAIRYAPRVTEADYLSRCIERTLAGASQDARQTALAQLIGSLDRDELAALQRRALDRGQATAVNDPASGSRRGTRGTPSSSAASRAGQSGRGGHRLVRGIDDPRRHRHLRRPVPRALPPA